MSSTIIILASYRYDYWLTYVTYTPNNKEQPMSP